MPSPTTPPRPFRRPLRCVLVALLACACGDGGRLVREPVASPTLRLGVPAPLGDFRVLASYEWYRAQFAALVFEGLTAVDDAGRVRPALARRWEAAPDGRTFRFTLRAGVRFHDGSPFSARDVVRAWTAALRVPADSAEHPWMLAHIEGAADVPRSGHPPRGLAAPDDSTLVVRLDEPLSLFPALLAMPQAAIPAAGASRRRPVGTGPWRWVRGGPDASEVWLARHAGYWAGPPALDSVVVRAVPVDEQDRAFARGRIDFSDQTLLRQQVLELAAREDVGYVESEAVGLARLVINVAVPELRDVRVRRALNHAIDVASLARAVAADNSVRAAGPVPPAMLGGTRRAPYRFDPAYARELLAEAGYPKQRALRLWVPLDAVADSSRHVGPLVRDYLQAVGLKVELHTMPGVDAPMERADLVLEAWYADYPDPDAFLFPLFHSRSRGSAGNMGRYGDAVLDSLIDAARREVDPARRLALQRAADERVFEQAASVFLWFDRTATVYSLRLAGWSNRVLPGAFTELRLARRGAS